MVVGEMVQQQHHIPSGPNDAFIGQQPGQIHHPRQQMFSIGQYTGQQTVQMPPQYQIYANEPIEPDLDFFDQQHVQLYQEHQSCPNGPNAGLIGQQPTTHKHPNPAHHINPNRLNAGFFGQQHIQMDPQHQICINGPNSGLVGQAPVQIQPQNQYPIRPNAAFVSQQNVQTHPQHQNEHQLVEMQQQYQFQQNSYPYSSPQQIWDWEQQYPMMGIGNPNQQQHDMIPPQTMGPQQMSQFNSNQNSASDPNQFSDLTLQAENTPHLSEPAPTNESEEEKKKQKRKAQRRNTMRLKKTYMNSKPFTKMVCLAMSGINALLAFFMLQTICKEMGQFIKPKTVKNKNKTENVVVGVAKKKKAGTGIATTTKSLKEYKEDKEKEEFIAKRVGELIYKVWSEDGKRDMAELFASNDEGKWAHPQKHIFVDEKHNDGAKEDKNAVVKQNGIWVFDERPFNLLALTLILKRQIPINPYEIDVKMECLFECDKHKPAGHSKAKCINPYHYAPRKPTSFDKWRYMSDSAEFGQCSSSSLSQPLSASSEMELQFEDEDFFESDN